MKIKVSVIVVFLLLFFNVARSQVKATTADGRKVILNTDGTWKYLESDADVDINSLKCEDLITENVDRVTGKASTRMMETLKVIDDTNDKALGFLMGESEGSLVLVIKTVGVTCINERDEANILFVDGSRAILKNDGDFNCKGTFTVLFNDRSANKTEQLLEVAKKEIETIRVWGGDEYVQMDLPQFERSKLRKSFHCMYLDWISKQ